MGGHRVHRFDGDEPEIQRNRDGERAAVVAGGVMMMTMGVVTMRMLIICMLFMRVRMPRMVCMIVV